MDTAFGASCCGCSSFHKEKAGAIKKPNTPLDDAGWVAGGLCVFGLFIHCRDWQFFLSCAGLGCAAWGIVQFIIRHYSSALQVFGLAAFSKKTSFFFLFGSAIGIGYANICRISYGETAFPGGLQWFALVACLIGATEELLYRGFIQGVVRQNGRRGAIIIASLCHTMYKCSLFMTFPLHDGIDVRSLAVATFFGGLVLGVLREASGSTWPALASHALFDTVTYGDCAAAPWWVWS